ncbi:MAG: hypothetical protein JW753_03975 [Dehalococcoidia bacterium]|nr:hypothetical protein [Dehalococcoidia bacterium]
MKFDRASVKTGRGRLVALLTATALLITMIPLLMALVEDHDSGDQSNTSPLVQLTPHFPVATNSLFCSIMAPGSDTNEGSLICDYAWYKDGVLQPQFTGDTVDGSYTAKGQTWRCIVTFNNGRGICTGFDEVTVGNSPPTAPVADVIPDMAYGGDDLVCAIKTPSFDADGDVITYTYAWYKDGVLQPNLTGDTVAASYTSRGETWRCAVTASDAESAVAGSFDEVSIPSGNNPPSAPVVAISPVLPTSTDSLLCSLKVESTDLDGDPVTYTYAWYKDGVLQPHLTGNTVKASYTVRGETWKCVVTVSDGQGGSAGGFCEATIHNCPPSPPLIAISPDEPLTIDNLECSITLASSDADGDAISYTYAWYKDGILQPQFTGSSVDSSYTSLWETWKCAVTASDGRDSSVRTDEVSITGEMKALYVWSWSWQLFDKVAEGQYFLDICSEEGINTAFVAAGDSDVQDLIQNSPAKIRRFIQDANASGVRVYALLARMDYGVEAALQPSVEAILKYNHDNPDCKFEGIHFDLEPPGGSSLSQHAAYLAECTTFFQHLKTWSYDGENVASQDVALGMFVDPRWSSSACAANYSSLVRGLDYMDIAAYRAPPETGIASVQGCVDLTVAEGKPFDIALETAEFPYNSDGATTYYEEGRAGLENCMSVMREYYKTNYADYCLGFAIHHYENSIQALHIIKLVQWPSGTYGVGSSVSATVTLHPSDYYYWRAYGVKLEVRDSAGTIWVISRIICMHYSSNTREVTLTWTVPSAAAKGSCDVRVSLWDVDLHDEGHYSKLWYSDFSSTYYGDSAGQKAALEAYSMESLAALTYRPADPAQALTGKRDPFIELQSSGWSEDLFNVT